HPYRRVVADLDPEEGGLRHADDLERVPVERNRGADGSRFRSEGAAPERVRDDRNGRAARAIVFRCEQPSGRGPHTERAEERAADEARADAARLAALAEIDARRSVCEQIAEER